MSTATLEPPEAAAEADADESPPSNPLDAFFTRIYFATHAFGEARRLDDVDATYKGQVLDKAMVNKAQALLIPNHLADPVRKARARLRRLVNAYSIRGDEEGTYCIPTGRVAEFVARFAEARAEFDDAATRVAMALNEIRDAAHAAWRPKMSDDSEYDRTIGRLLPTDPQALLESYSIEMRLCGAPAGGIGGGFKTAAVESWFAEIAANAREHEEAARREQFVEPIRRLREALGKLKEQANTGKKLEVRSFTSTMESLALFKACASIIDPGIVAEVDAVYPDFESAVAEATAARDAGRSQTKALAARIPTLNTIIDKIVAECDDAAEAVERTGRMGVVPRGLDF